MLELKGYVAKSDQGPKLSINEDRINVDLKNKLYLVADGFGGANIGDLAAQSVLDTIGTSYYNWGLDPDSTMPFFYNPQYLLECNALINALHFAHKKLLEKNSSLGMSERGGASAILVAQSENLLSIISVGCSKAYYLRSGKLHSLVLPDSIGFSGNAQSNRSIPLSAFGLFEHISYSLLEFRPQAGDHLLFFTEGMYGHLTSSKIEELANQYEELGKDFVVEMMEYCNIQGNNNNQTTLLLSY